MCLRIFFILLLFASQEVSAQEYKFLIRFKDKINDGYSLSEPSAFLSDKAIQRRQNQHIQIDSTDLPVNSAYINSILSVPSTRILNRSRWFNLVMIGVTDTTVLQQVRSFPFVVSSEQVNNHRKKITDSVSVNQISGPASKTESQGSEGLSAPYSYGSSFAQVHIHHGEYLHGLGFHGEGMTIAILDAGFNNYLSNPAFDSVRLNHKILGTYDFVNQKISVNEEHVHGANCFSIIAGNLPGIFVGTAPAANFWLFKTEDVNSESPTEEQNWVAAAEFADSAGADMISTSLGYGQFDNAAYDLDYTERNGHSSLISRAANLAVAKGIIVTASAGNSGADAGDTKFVMCPADGDSVYTVGAVNSGGVISSFSSWGPNSSGQVKPDGVSVGSGTYLVGPDGQVESGNGTSYSNPNMAGLIACFWQAFPEFNVHDILYAVRQSSNLYSTPDVRMGFGLPDFAKAYQLLMLKRFAQGNSPSTLNWIRAFPSPFENKIYLIILPSVSGPADIQLMNVSGKLIQSQSITVTAGQMQLVEYTITQPLASGVYFIRYSDPNEMKTLKLLKK